MTLVIRNGRIALPGGGEWLADIACEGPRIAAIGPALVVAGAQELDAAGLIIGPGLIDVHVHGGGGHSFFTREAERVRAYARWAPRNGVTGFFVSTLGRDDDDTVAVFEGLRPAIGGEAGDAEALGFHMEGPFINPERKGAFHPRMLRPPAVEEFARYQAAAGGAIRQVTFAPELPGGIELARAIADSGAMPSMGHTDASVAQARAGFAAGACHVTHLFNAMRPIHQREPGPAVAAMLDAGVTCELIFDGAHVDPALLRLAYQALGPNRTVVVTDNLDIAGTVGVASSTFAGREVTVSGASAVRDDGTIVGSVATMDQHFRNARAFLGIDTATAFQLCSANPARIAGVSHRKGRLARGYDADIAGFDEAGRVALTICRGEIAYIRTQNP